jgi:hypothetical protein
LCVLFLVRWTVLVGGGAWIDGGCCWGGPHLAAEASLPLLPWASGPLGPSRWFYGGGSREARWWWLVQAVGHRGGAGGRPPAAACSKSWCRWAHALGGVGRLLCYQQAYKLSVGVWGVRFRWEPTGMGAASLDQ